MPRPWVCLWPSPLTTISVITCVPLRTRCSKPTKRSSCILRPQEWKTHTAIIPRLHLVRPFLLVPETRLTEARSVASRISGSFHRFTPVGSWPQLIGLPRIVLAYILGLRSFVRFLLPINSASYHKKQLLGCTVLVTLSSTPASVSQQRG